MYGNQVFDEPAGCNFPVIFLFLAVWTGVWRFFWAGGLVFALGFTGIELNYQEHVEEFKH